MNCPRLASLAFAFTTLALGQNASASYSQMYVFGDSLSDGGNVSLATGGLFPPQPYSNRFSNGPVAVERLAADLGLSLTPSLLGGGNYAYGGAATGDVVNGTGTFDNHIPYEYAPYFPALSALNGWTGIDKQVASFVATPHAGMGSSLFVVWGGPNDLFLNPTPQTATQAATNLTNSIASLASAGAKYILVPSLLDLSLTSEGQASDFATQAGLSGLSALFNAALLEKLSGLEATYSGLDIITFDTSAAFQSVIANAGSLGITNTSGSCVSEGCFLTGLADQYLFWDGVHPTAHAHQILGDMLFAAAVPEPQTYALILIGLALVSGAARQGRSP